LTVVPDRPSAAFAVPALRSKLTIADVCPRLYILSWTSPASAPVPSAVANALNVEVVLAVKLLTLGLSSWLEPPVAEHGKHLCSQKD
jgi:hypothetical protein